MTGKVVPELVLGGPGGEVGLVCVFFHHGGHGGTRRDTEKRGWCGGFFEPRKERKTRQVQDAGCAWGSRWRKPPGHGSATL